ncbi:hypothetical protein HPB50_002928 [Hyalomma asiaticum]|uniref:Uncharacterized protein n=1 Tax=Hyalomma asiaticum TaxID=266040 RepID=A0ACB7TDU8_HYAAI|nr:hypothetical protein HPB50_002928 [Hyalomma asiaticum]
MSIDYALAPDRLVKVLQRLYIDEEGMHSLETTSVDFDWISLKPNDKTQEKNQGKLEKVAEQFEASLKREEAKTYEEYVSELCRIIERHKARSGKRPARYGRMPWWAKEFAAAWHERWEANRSRCRAVKMKDAVQTDVTWQRYLQLKRDVQALVQAKLAKSNALFRQNAAQKRAITDKPVQDMREALIGHEETLYGPLGCTRDPQLDERDSQGDERPEGLTEEEALKREFSRTSLDRARFRLRAPTASGQMASRPA